MKSRIISILLFAVLGNSMWAQEKLEETFPPLKDGKVPQTVNELWKDFDPRKEPLDTEILQQWEEEDVVMQVLRYRVGIFKGQKALVAAVYGYPKGAENLPGLVQIHGGGQYADYRAVLTNAKRGYATISISWAGRINAPDYRVTPDVVKLFWAGDTLNPDYKLTTDWGILDGYHAPCRNPQNNFASIKPQSWTLDSVESPRNNSWFLATLAARRALTFLEQQPQVNPEMLGVYGHSMGGRITVLTATDPRVKAAAPSCGGISGNDNESKLYRKTLADSVYLKKITCPIIILNPSNDFHGHFQDIPAAVKFIKSDNWRVVSSAHHSHQDHGNFEVAGLLWFDQFLKNEFTFPETPKTELNLKTTTGTPLFTVFPDASMPILEVEVYYTQQGEFDANFSNLEKRNHRKNRFWHYAFAQKKGAAWKAELPLEDTSKPLWAYAIVRYQLNRPVTGAGYYYRVYTARTFHLSSPVKMIRADQLIKAGVIATLKPSLIIEDFKDSWEKDWFAYKPDRWEMATHKIYNDLWKAPENAMLTFDVRCEKPNILVVSSLSYAAEIQLEGGMIWQKIEVPAKMLKNPLGKQMQDWSAAMELKFSANGNFREKAEGETHRLELGAPWKGEKPEFRNMKWIRK